MNQSVFGLLRIAADDPADRIDRVEERLASLIDTGVLPAGSRLPATRELALLMGVSRGYLLSAIRRLEGTGRLKSRVGSGVTVLGPGKADTVAAAPRFSGAVMRLQGSESFRTDSAPVFADFSRLAPDEQLFPLEDFLRTLSDTGRRRRDLWQYGSPYGLPELKAEIGVRLRQAGAPWSADDILITAGAQQGLDLLFKAFVDPGDSVAVESPTYPGVLPLIRFYGADTIEMPVAGGEIETSSLAGRRASLVYVMPDRQNPTGETLSEDARRVVLARAAAAGALVVEDGYDSAASSPAPLSSIDKRRVATLGSFSKDMAPGFRVGWVAADRPVLQALALVKQTADLQTPLPLQAALAEFLRLRRDVEGGRRRRAQVDERAEEMARALCRHLPELRFRGGPGGALFWLELPLGTSGREVARRALARGVRVAPGYEFDPRSRDLPALRLSVSRVAKSVVAEGVARLSETIREIEARSARPVAIPTL
jgi:DNA-binding transcriptional MocR family regulator